MSDKPKIVFDVNIYARTYNEDGLVTDFFSIQGEHLDDATSVSYTHLTLPTKA